MPFYASSKLGSEWTVKTIYKTQKEEKRILTTKCARLSPLFLPLSTIFRFRPSSRGLTFSIRLKAIIEGSTPEHASLGRHCTPTGANRRPTSIERTSPPVSRTPPPTLFVTPSRYYRRQSCFLIPIKGAIWAQGLPLALHSPLRSSFLLHHPYVPYSPIIPSILFFFSFLISLSKLCAPTIGLKAQLTIPIPRCHYALS
jgi:hypothetical protein